MNINVICDGLEDYGYYEYDIVRYINKDYVNDNEVNFDDYLKNFQEGLLLKIDNEYFIDPNIQTYSKLYKYQKKELKNYKEISAGNYYVMKYVNIKNLIEYIESKECDILDLLNYPNVESYKYKTIKECHDWILNDKTNDELFVNKIKNIHVKLYYKFRTIYNFESNPKNYNTLHDDNRIKDVNKNSNYTMYINEKTSKYNFNFKTDGYNRDVSRTYYFTFSFLEITYMNKIIISTLIDDVRKIYYKGRTTILNYESAFINFNFLNNKEHDNKIIFNDKETSIKNKDINMKNDELFNNLKFNYGKEYLYFSFVLLFSIYDFARNFKAINRDVMDNYNIFFYKIRSNINDIHKYYSSDEFKFFLMYIFEKHGERDYGVIKDYTTDNVKYKRSILSFVNQNNIYMYGGKTSKRNRLHKPRKRNTKKRQITQRKKRC